MAGPSSILHWGRRFFGLSHQQRLLFLRALAAVALIRVGLWLLHPTYVLRRVEGAVESRRRVRRRQPASVSDITTAVRAASRRIPAASCLVQALAVRLLLAEHGNSSALKIGVAQGENGRIDAHAWVEVEGSAVIGGLEAGRFTAFPDIEGVLSVAWRRFGNRSI